MSGFSTEEINVILKAFLYVLCVVSSCLVSIIIFIFINIIKSIRKLYQDNEKIKEELNIMIGENKSNRNNKKD